MNGFVNRNAIAARKLMPQYVASNVNQEVEESVRNLVFTSRSLRQWVLICSPTKPQKVAGAKGPSRDKADTGHPYFY